jgi:hypothetical protein
MPRQPFFKTRVNGTQGPAHFFGESWSLVKRSLSRWLHTAVRPCYNVARMVVGARKDTSNTRGSREGCIGAYFSLGTAVIDRCADAASGRETQDVMSTARRAGEAGA